MALGICPEQSAPLLVPRRRSLDDFGSDASALPETNEALVAREWLALYVAEFVRRPSCAADLFRFIATKRGRLSYSAVREAVASSDPASLLLPPPAPCSLPCSAGAGGSTGGAKEGVRDGAGLLWYSRPGRPTEAASCSICHREDGGEPICELHCGGRHRFHRACIVGHVAETCRPTCPECQQVFLAAGVFDLD